MKSLSAFKRPFIWLMRFRHRCGYGVHSPFAFELITSVIYEKTSYYAYEDIEVSVKYRVRKRTEKHITSKKTNQLLFRLTNRFQPAFILQTGEPTLASFYLQSGCKKSKFECLSAKDNYSRHAVSPDFLYIPYSGNPEEIRSIVECFLPKAGKKSVYVIGGIGYNKSMKNIWKEIKACNNTVTSFDLYDLGIILFDNTLIEQHYIVNF